MRHLPLAEHSHLGIWGSSGTGKSSYGEFLASRIFFDELHAKVIDLWDEGRGENSMYAFPQTQTNLLKKLDNFNRFLASRNVPTRYSVKKYPLQVMFPAINGLTAEVPEFWQPFRIPFDEIEVDDFSILLEGGISPTASAVLSLITRNSSASSLDDLISTVVRFIDEGTITVSNREVRLMNTSIAGGLLRKLIALRDSGLIGNKGDELNINLSEIMRQKDTITSFSLAFIQTEELRFLFYHWLLRRIVKLRFQERYPALCLYVRELANLAPASSAVNPFGLVTRSTLAKLSREGRDLGVHLLLESQRVSDLSDSVLGNVSHHHIFRVFAAEAEVLSGVIPIPLQFRKKVPFLPTGQFLYVSPQGCELRSAIPPLHHHKEKNEDLKVLCEKFGVQLKHVSFQQPVFETDRKPKEKPVETENQTVEARLRESVRAMLERDPATKITYASLASQLGLKYASVSVIFPRLAIELGLKKIRSGKGVEYVLAVPALETDRTSV